MDSVGLWCIGLLSLLRPWSGNASESERSRSWKPKLQPLRRTVERGIRNVFKRLFLFFFVEAFIVVIF